MVNTNATNFRKRVFTLLEQTIRFNEPVNISTKDGNAVLISEEDYNNLTETLYISSVPGLKASLIENGSKPDSEFIPENGVKW